MKSILVMIIFLFFYADSIWAQTEIRKVDFKNFTYNLSCNPNDKTSMITVKNGKFYGNKNGIETFVHIADVKFGDINSDKIDEATVIYGCGSGASGYYSRGLIFTVKNNKPIILALIEGGDKGNGGINEMKIVRNVLVIDRLQLPPASGIACCSAFIETTKYRLKNKKLVRVGKVNSRKISSAD